MGREISSSALVGCWAVALMTCEWSLGAFSWSTSFYPPLVLSVVLIIVIIVNFIGLNSSIFHSLVNFGWGKMDLESMQCGCMWWVQSLDFKISHRWLPFICSARACQLLKCAMNRRILVLFYQIFRSFSWFAGWWLLDRLMTIWSSVALPD